MELETSKSKIAFMSCMSREIVPSKMPNNRFGNSLSLLRGSPNTGPGCYNTESKTNFMHQIETHVESKKGYSLGARTAPRVADIFSFQTPSPNHYQKNLSQTKRFKTANKPFEVGSDRFPVRRKQMLEVFPGPGTYHHDIPRNRQVQWHQAFGGHPIMMPPISVQSTIPKNTDKLFSTKEEQKFHRKLAYLKLYYD